MASDSAINIIKSVSMVIMFSVMLITGILPLRWEKFRKNTIFISLATAFSGGLFLGVGILHLLPEAQEAIASEIEDLEFPWSNLICVIIFAMLLCIEKVLFANFVHHGHNHGHTHGEREQHHGHCHAPLPVTENKEKETETEKAKEIKDVEAANSEDADDEEQINAQRKVSLVHQVAVEAGKMSQTQLSLSDKKEPVLNKFTPYILQVAIGIHSIFEGLAIGIASNNADCLGIAIAILCHKWAEGFTLGLAYFKANVKLKTAYIMILIESIMNPFGIFIGWLLSGKSGVITGVFQAISAGTFLYIATGEIIIHEFNLKRHRFFKFFLFCVAIGFVTSLYFIERATGGHDHGGHSHDDHDHEDHSDHDH